MLTNGDRVKVNAGDFAHEYGTVIDTDLDDGLIGVELDEGAPSRFRPERLDPAADIVNHPPHYTSHPSGIECIQITEHMGFNLGNSLKYIWRADLKGDAIEDLKKAAWYINREIEKREAK